MPKMKTRRSAAKRFKLTGTGRIRRNKANHRHMLIRPSTSTKRQMRNAGFVCRAAENRVRRMLGI